MKRTDISSEEMTYKFSFSFGNGRNLFDVKIVRSLVSKEAVVVFAVIRNTKMVINLQLKINQ